CSTTPFRQFYAGPYPAAPAQWIKTLCSCLPGESHHATPPRGLCLDVTPARRWTRCRPAGTGQDYRHTEDRRSAQRQAPFLRPGTVETAAKPVPAEVSNQHHLAGVSGIL